MLISYLPGKDEDLSSHVKIAACFFPGQIWRDGQPKQTPTSDPWSQQDIITESRLIPQTKWELPSVVPAVRIQSRSFKHFAFSPDEESLSFWCGPIVLPFEKNIKMQLVNSNREKFYPLDWPKKRKVTNPRSRPENCKPQWWGAASYCIGVISATSSNDLVIMKSKSVLIWKLAPALVVMPWNGSRTKANFMWLSTVWNGNI